MMRTALARLSVASMSVLFSACTVGCGDPPQAGPEQRVAAVTSADLAPEGPRRPVDLGRQALGPNDGWASVGDGTSGGSQASAGQVYLVKTRGQLIAALNNGVGAAVSPATPSNEPKVIYVDGTINFNVDEADAPLTCADYQRDGYTRQAFLAAFDPATWGRAAPTGPLEMARLASRNAQQERVRIRVGSNTTLVGRGRDARLRGVWLDVRGTANVPGSRSNVIIRNITFQDTHDCFPEWAPTDGAAGTWNALYDSISLRDTTRVWIDGNTFEDQRTADAFQPEHFGVLFQVHDGLLDITNASDLVTVSWNRFRNHDKVMLIGSSDSAAGDRGHLRVTLHHNVFEGVRQRAPRVRFGQVHVYNNLYRLPAGAPYLYSWGVGVESALYAENNLFETEGPVAAATFIQRFSGGTIFETGTIVHGNCGRDGGAADVDVVAEWNAANDPDLNDLATWTPLTPMALIPPASEVPAAIDAHSDLARGK